MNRSELIQRYLETRQLSTQLTEPLRAEDYRIQSMPDVSPPWWNLGHTTWFFAKNILEPYRGYTFPNPHFEYVLNSYYEKHGQRLPRAERGLVTRPTTDEILELRRDVDRLMLELLADLSVGDPEALSFLVITGIQHEQQHQELLLSEVKHILGTNVRGLREPYLRGRESEPPRHGAPGPPRLRWLELEGGLDEFGNLEGGWCWDNETPVHRAFIAPLAISNRLVTVGEYLQFVDDGGYKNALLWLANGWEQVQRESWQAPLYWEEPEGGWNLWTLAGNRELDPHEPVCHLSYYEADAFATWFSEQRNDAAGSRLPTEHEWEQASRRLGFAVERGTFLEDQLFHPQVAVGRGRGEEGDGALLQTAGDLWEWTSSHYEPYPGYRPFEGALMEYNGKFMDNQRVLRGGSCATPRSHIRLSYRNFWPAETRFQFTGLRLARSL